MLEDRHHQRIETLLEHSQSLKVIYEKRLALQQIWVKTSSNGHDMLAAIKEWVHEAEASGIQSLRDFAKQKVIQLSGDYVPPIERDDILVLGRTGLGAGPLKR